jgi:PKD repeat protein
MHMKPFKIVSLLVLLSVIAFGTSPNVAAQPTTQVLEPTDIGEWQTGSFPPTGFQYARHDGAFVPGPALEPWANKIYFPGGRTSPGTESPNIWMFDPVTGAYTDTGADVIEDVSNYNANLVMDDGTGRGPAIYVIGGTDKDHGGISIGTVQRYYPQINHCEALPPVDDWNGMVGGSRVAAMGTAVVEDVIYVYGGWETNVAPFFSSETWAFDPTQPSGSRWTNLGTPLSTPRSYIMSAVQDGKVYAIGGVGSYVGGELDPVDTFEVLDTANLAVGWTLLAPMPAPGGEGRAFGFDSDTLNLNSPYQGKLYVVAPNDWPDVSGEVLEYDIATNTWRDDLPELPTPRADMAGSFVPLCTSDPYDGLPGLWTFGGRINESCDPPMGPTEYAPMVCDSVCTGLTDIAIGGPEQLLVGETGDYSATILPVDASAPVSLLWDNGETSPETSYTWDMPGSYTVVITGTNCDDTSVVTGTLVVDVSCAALTGAEIDGPTNLLVGETGSYSVMFTPITATLPIDILWSNGITETQADYAWDEPGSYTVSVTASNCDGASVVSDTLLVDVYAGLTGAEIAGPASLLVGETGSYSVTLTPLTATLPIDILWSNGVTETQADYSWEVPGSYSVSVMASNLGGSFVVTDSLMVDVLCTGLTGAEIAGPASLLVGETGLYSVTLTPLTATLPIDILWSNGITETQAAFSWDEPGSYSVSVMAMNCDGTVVTATLEVEVTRPPYLVWLPLLARTGMP